MPTGHQVMQRPQPTQPELPELVPPGGELVGQPLAVAIAGPGAEAAAGDLGEARAEAAVPAPVRDRLGAREVGRLGERRAEAGRAGEGAVAAGDAALGDLGPARVVELGEEAVVAGRRPGPGRRCGPGRRRPWPRRRTAPAEVAGASGQPLQHRVAGRRVGLDEEAAVELGQQAGREPPVDLGAGAHRGAEAGRRRRRALDGDDEDALRAGPRSRGRRTRSAGQDAVLHAERGELAGADAEEGELGRLGVLGREARRCGRPSWRG